MRTYGWRPDVPDHRDYTYMVKRRVKALPPTADLRKKCPAVYNQEDLGSCTTNAIGACYEFDLLKQGCSDFTPSRLGLYYDERVVEGTVKSDSGAQIRTGIKVIAKQGCYPESLWPYDTSKFDIKPPAKCYKEAAKHQALVYERVPRTADGIYGVLADGLPFVFGFSVYSAFEGETVARTGVLYLPKKNEQFIGGHAVVAVGYSMKTKRIIVRNSWGKDWGKNGHFTMPIDYLLNSNLSDDFWVIRTVEG